VEDPGTEGVGTRVFAMNAGGTWNCIRAVVPDVKRQTSGKIVTLPGQRHDDPAAAGRERQHGVRVIP
jgi:hypothetical protein